MRVSFMVKENRSKVRDSRFEQLNNSKSASASLLVPVSEKEDSEFVEFVKAISAKTKKHSHLAIILKFFLGLTSFIDLLSKLFPDCRVLLNSLIENFEYESQKKNHMLFRIDDVGEEFYIILKGTVKVMIYKQRQYMLTKREYLEYLLKLKLYDERIMLKKTLDVYSNNKLYPISELEFSMIKAIEPEKSAPLGVDLDLRKSTSSKVSKSIYDMVKTSIQVMDTSLIQLRNSKNNSKFLIDPELYNQVLSQCVDYEKYNISYTDRFKIDPSKLIIKKSAKEGVEFNTIIKGNQDVFNRQDSGIYPITTLTYNSKPENFDSDNDSNHNENLRNETKAPLRIDNNERFEFSIFKYSEVNILTKGMCFGNLALEDAQGKRTAAVVCLEDCMFATLNKNVYTSSLMDANKKFIQQNINFFLRFNFFNDIHYKIFERKIYQKMTYKRTSKGNHVISQGSPLSHIYFLKSGEYVLGFKGTIQHADKLIEILGGARRKSKDELFLFQNSPEFTKECNSIHYFNIKIIVEVGYLGFSEHIHNGISLFDVICKSQVGEYFIMDVEVSLYN